MQIHTQGMIFLCLRNSGGNTQWLYDIITTTSNSMELTTMVMKQINFNNVNTHQGMIFLIICKI